MLEPVPCSNSSGLLLKQHLLRPLNLLSRRRPSPEDGRGGDLSVPPRSLGFGVCAVLLAGSDQLPRRQRLGSRFRRKWLTSWRSPEVGFRFASSAAIYLTMAVKCHARACQSQGPSWPLHSYAAFAFGTAEW